MPPAWRGDQVRTLFIGSSHVGNGITQALPDYGPETGVLHYPGIDARLALQAFAKHEERWPRLEVAVIEIDEFVLYTDSEASRKKDMSPLAGRLWLNLWELPWYPDEPERAWWRVSNLLRGHGLILLNPDLRFTTTNVLKRSYGVPEIFSKTTAAKAPSKPAAPELTAERGQARVEFLRRVSRTRNDENVAAFSALVRRVSDRGVKVVFLTLPTHANYTAARPKEWDDLARSVAEAGRRASGQEIPWWDLRGDARFSADELYQDIDHLNREGAHQMAGVLGPQLRALLR